MSGTVPSSPLLSVAGLAAQLSDPALRVVDCRHDLANPAAGEAAYGVGHIPGAVFAHLDRDLSGAMNGRNGRHPLPEAATLAARLGLLGIGPETRVVAYDDGPGMFAARLWWLLRWLGHDRVAVLDGGLAAWKSAGHPLETPRPEPISEHLPWRSAMDVVSAGEVLENLDRRAFQLVDARAPDRFRGENETLDPVGGHIPGAINRFFRDNLAPDGTFKPAARLRQEWQTLLAGRDPARVVHQCGSGVTACHNLLAMEVAGLAGSRLYAGSWSEWVSDPARPVAR
ncbi:thiosulfate sulfurtransferase [Oryzomicrobium terrae]|uniref:Thiosulfate sulfurtransferase n=1 Tax=Oryzomicrobium terrae TaxID=1735038 RepID=A0A5C1E6H7_9RHOO|nr:thiosulfate sulfurtransferase [Oryzomicrobium terrae]